MILLSGAVRVYFATAPVNLRSFDGLSNEVRAVLGRDPVSGHVFVFLNRRKTQVKLLLPRRPSRRRLPARSLPRPLPAEPHAKPMPTWALTRGADWRTDTGM